ncbi:MAG: ABC transporter ATP-binding protein [Myxococcota bacterium]
MTAAPDTAPDLTPPLVVASDVRKTFLHEGNEVEVLKGVDLTLKAGEMVSVVGRSGAGKSTLLHLLGTLDLPTSGAITYLGEDVTRLDAAGLAAFRNRTLGFVFQFHHLLPEFDALENVMMPGLVRGVRRGALRDRAKALLAEVGLSHRLKHRPGELSGGEQQRVALARALVMEPRLVLADEPTGNLDTTTSEAIHRLFFELNERRGTTFLIVTHNPDLARRMPRVVRMRDGRVEDDGAGSTAPSPADPSTPADAPSVGEAAETSNEASVSGVEAAG